jgi:hypothetical protein
MEKMIDYAKQIRLYNGIGKHEKNNHSKEEENQRWSDGHEERKRCPWNINLSATAA